ncbi:glycosyl transferase family 2 [Planotetraspora silvatica]|uniref:Glycosyl transferase family 2 n=1 Tax=Planotetraspora silvatica TaxID=234614 RepID=A0A8J3XMW6_9ACTN|nr:glycosyltransferase family 2 protein [Planotetraspora silvatica]GII45696.1 glycosyl transferase family 2 [Planotetraspora silvatica]
MAHDDPHVNFAALRVAVVVVTYNSADVLEDCLRSLTDGDQDVRLTDVVVADNASKDDSLAIAKGTAHIPVTTVQVGRNAGYAAAINAGTDALDPDGFDAVLVLNPDCRLRPGALSVLARALREPGRGIAVPRLINPDGSLQPSLRRMPTVFRAVVQSAIGGNLAGRIGTLGEMIRSPRQYEHAQAAAWATGAAMLISAAAMREIGPWDESYLLYSEETDYALRAGDLGWTLWYEPTALVEHIGGESRTSPMLAALVTVNRVRLYRRRKGPFVGAIYFLAVVVGEAVRAAAGRPTARASLVALLRPSRRLRALPG